MKSKMRGFRCAFTDLATDLCFYSPGIQGSQAAVFLSTTPSALLPIRTASHKEMSSEDQRCVSELVPRQD